MSSASSWRAAFPYLNRSEKTPVKEGRLGSVANDSGFGPLSAAERADRRNVSAPGEIPRLRDALLRAPPCLGTDRLRGPFPAHLLSRGSMRWTPPRRHRGHRHGPALSLARERFAEKQASGSRPCPVARRSRYRPEPEAPRSAWPPPETLAAEGEQALCGGRTDRRIGLRFRSAAAASARLDPGPETSV